MKINDRVRLKIFRWFFSDKLELEYLHDPLREQTTFQILYGADSQIILKTVVISHEYIRDVENSTYAGYRKLPL